MSVTCYIEIEQGSNEKYEYNHQTGRLELDRILPEPYRYPFAYGFIPGTKADDDDEIDIVVVSDIPIRRGDTLQCRLIGALEMEDEKGNDIKLLVIPCDKNHENINDIIDIDDEDLKKIAWFFENYKSKDANRWSKIGRFIHRHEATREYEHSIV